MTKRQKPCTLHLSIYEKLILLVVFFGLLSSMFGCSPKMIGTKTKNGCGAWHPKKFKA